MKSKNQFRIDTSIIPQDVGKIVDSLNPSESYVVGGIVRDITRGILEGSTPAAQTLVGKDWDIATACPPDEAMKRLRKRGFVVFPIGIEHGTVVVLPRTSTGKADPNRRYEVTTFRFDRECDGRHAIVQFTDKLEEDLARRDFTVNAMALDVASGEIIDYVGGIDDLSQRSIRSVGEPSQRFEEDYLRLIRAIRFATAIDGRIENKTWQALCEKAEGIGSISSERIRDEVMKILTYRRPSRAFLMMHEAGLLEIFFPELAECFGVCQNKYHVDDIAVHTLLVMDAISPKYPLLRFSALVHDLGKVKTRTFLEEKQDYTFYNHEMVGAKMAERVMKRLRFSRDEIEFASLMTRVHMYPFQPAPSKKTLRRWLNKIGPENFRSLIRLKIADRRGNRRQPQWLEPGMWQTIRLLREIERDQDALTLKDLKINGYDLIQLGLQPGPDMGGLLEKLLDLVFEDPSLNDRDTLLDRAKEMLGQT